MSNTPNPIGLRGVHALALLAVLATAPASALLAQRFASERLALEDSDNSLLTLEELEVSGERLERTEYKGNLDLLRTEYDVQPYSIIGREAIVRSGATSVEELLNQQLTMSSAFSSGAQSNTGGRGLASSFSLRGMSPAETLILINGRRMAAVGSNPAQVVEAGDQPDLNGIPLSAIERIEVLPASASAIYGASAIGGVINVVLRRDYTGHELNTRFEMTDDGHAPIETFNWTSSLQLEGGRTQILVSTQYQDRRALYGHQRDFQRKGREQILERDPASLYGTPNTTGNPPSGALVNIRSRTGQPLFGPGSSYFTHIPKGYRGWAIDGLQPLIDNQGSYNLDLARGIVSGFTADEELLSGSRGKSITLNSSREMTDNLKLFFDGSYSQNDQSAYFSYFAARRVARLSASSPNNPFGQDVMITYPAHTAVPDLTSTVRSKRAAVGFDFALPREWRLVGNTSWSQSYNHHQFMQHTTSSPTREDAINSGTLDILRDTTSFPTDIDAYGYIQHQVSKAWTSDSTLRAAGGLGGWWYAGDITLASGAEHRRLRSRSIPNLSDPQPRIRRQQVDSIYAEATVPLVAPHQRRPGLHRADLQLAARHERFNVESVGSKFETTVPTFGLRYLPVRELVLRGSYGRGFRAPTYSQLTEPTFSTNTTTVNDPLRGGEAVNILTLTGGNPDITPETSRNLNLGLVWSPERAPGLRLSADWFKIEKRNNIATPATQLLLDQEALFPGRVVRGPADPSDPHYPVGPIIHINRQVMNMLMMETSGIDLGLRYLWKAGNFGDFDTALNATLSDYYRTQTSATSGIIERKGIPSQSGPLDRRINGSVQWVRRQWNVGWAAQYYSSYRLNPSSASAILRQGGPRVASQIYHDLFVRYRVAARGHRAFEGLELTLGAKNVFDARPPTDMSRGHFYSTFGDPRMRRLYANVKKTF